MWYGHLYNCIVNKPIQFYRGKYFSLLYKKCKGVIGSSDEKQPRATILNTACSFIQHFYRNMSISHLHFINLYRHVKAFICFPGKFLITKQLLPKPVNCQLWLTVFYFPLQKQAAGVQILIQWPSHLTHSNDFKCYFQYRKWREKIKIKNCAIQYIIATLVGIWSGKFYSYYNYLLLTGW